MICHPRVLLVKKIVDVYDDLIYGVGFSIGTNVWITKFKRGTERRITNFMYYVCYSPRIVICNSDVFFIESFYGHLLRPY